MSSNKCPYCEYYMWEGKEFYECELEQENAELGKIIDSKNGTITTLANTKDELKAENERLKEATDGLLKIQYTLADNCKKYSEILQEIREIVTGVRSYLEVPAPRDVRYEMDRILDCITKAEEE